MTRTLLALAAAAGVGLAVSRFFTGGLARAERAAWALACGLLIHVTLYAGGILLRLHPGPRKLLLAEAVILAAALLLRRPGRATEPASQRRGAPEWASVLCLAAAAAGALLFALSALAEPMWATDFLAIWGLKGKTIFFASGIPDALFRDPALAWSHPEYPLLLPLHFASFAAVARDWNDRALALLYPAFHLGTMLAAYGFLTRRAGRLAGAVAAALIGLFLPLYRAGHVGMADIPLAFGLVVLSCAFLDAREESSASVRARLALGSLFCAATKQEGLLYVGLLAATMLLLPARRTGGGSRSLDLAALLLPAAAHAASFRAATGHLDHRDFDLSLLVSDRWPELTGRTVEVIRRLLTVELAAAALPLIAVAVLLAVSRRNARDVLLVPVVAQVLIYAAIPVLSIYGAAWHVQTSFARTVAALFPVAAIVLGARVGLLLAPEAPDRHGPTSRARPGGRRSPEKAPGIPPGARGAPTAEE